MYESMKHVMLMNKVGRNSHLALPESYSCRMMFIFFKENSPRSRTRYSWRRTETCKRFVDNCCQCWSPGGGSGYDQYHSLCGK